MVDIPERWADLTTGKYYLIVCRPDDQAQIIIDGVESEQVEEENDALNDMRAELGEKHLLRMCRNISYLF